MVILKFYKYNFIIKLKITFSFQYSGRLASATTGENGWDKVNAQSMELVY
jgi:hypothetical protein